MNFGSLLYWNSWQVVYMDEPSTGLDPASRNMLWNVVKRAKQNRAIILTSNYFALICPWTAQFSISSQLCYTARFTNISLNSITVKVMHASYSIFQRILWKRQRIYVIVLGFSWMGACNALETLKRYTFLDAVFIYIQTWRMAAHTFLFPINITSDNPAHMMR